MNEKLKNFLKNFIKVQAYESGKGYNMLRYSFGFIKFERKNIPKLKKLNKYYIKNPRVYLSIVCIAKDEGPYIKEWIEYHKLVGVERFYFYDNGSTDNTREILAPYIKDGTVVYNYIEGKCLQNLAYADAVVKYKNQTRWLAIIDLDEFIVPVEKNSISEFLKDYEKYPAVGINWVMFDSNGHQTLPLSGGGLVTANYTRVKKDYNDKINRYIKSIVNPKEVQGILDPHYSIYKSDKFAVNEKFDILYGSVSKYHTSQKIQINHYFTKSFEEYSKKLSRGSAFNGRKKFFNESQFNFSEYTYDYAIQKYLPELEKRMQINMNSV